MTTAADDGADQVVGEVPVDPGHRDRQRRRCRAARRAQSRSRSSRDFSAPAWLRLKAPAERLRRSRRASPTWCWRRRPASRRPPSAGRCCTRPRRSARRRPARRQPDRELARRAPGSRKKASGMKHQPGEHAAREVDRRELEADDVADADERRRDRRRGEGDRAAGAARRPSGARDESKWWMTEAGSCLKTSTDSRKSRMPGAVLADLDAASPSPIAPKTYLAPVAPACPALTIAAQALLSGNGSAASTASVRRSRVMNSTPSMPPTSRIRRLPVVEAGPQPGQSKFYRVLNRNF